MTNFIRTLVRKRDRERVQVRCSDLVSSDLPHLLEPGGVSSDFLHLSKSDAPLR